MPELKKYMKRVKHYGCEMVLETAATDPDIEDDEYETLWEAVDARERAERRRPKGISPVHKLRDREVAAAELAP